MRSVYVGSLFKDKMRTDQKLFCLKCVLTVFIVILWLLGAAVFSTLLWLRLDFWTNEYLELDQSLDRYVTLLYISLVDAFLIVIFSIFGLVGGIRKVKWALAVYLTAICLALALTISGTTYGFVYREQLKDTVGKNDLIRNVVTQKFTGETRDYMSRAVNIMQSELKCCGGDDPRDYMISNWQQQNPEARKRAAPLSCCHDYFRYSSDSSEVCPLFKFETQGEEILNDRINSEGCKTALVRFFDNYIVVVAGVAITIGVIQIITISIISMLLHFLNSLYTPQPDDIVYDMAHNQEKSPYPSRGDYRDYYA